MFIHSTSRWQKMITTAATVFVFLAPSAFADDSQRFQGEYEFASHCATCHGMDGRGNGPMASALNTLPPSLTDLTAKNDGVFPYEKVFAVIEGRVTADAHGRDMPIWGERYNLEVKTPVVRARILELAMYVRSIQE